ncbi:thioredoxin family protein [Tsukamurella pulmonis]|nr:thioredoxin family protein [Tsukamurella pulmonis]
MRPVPRFSTDVNAGDYSIGEHAELGDVRWRRDFDAAMSEAKERNLPVLLLFQEIPGCSTCVNFGQDVLAHPLMVEMIESHFVPLAIFNNRDGADAEVLRRFNEPAWNNPVVYFLSPDGDELIPKLTNRYDLISLHDKITGALTTSGTSVPDWFGLFRGDLLIEAGIAEGRRYETPCFWSGETSLAQLPGVISTDAGWIEGEEVVEIYFDPAATSADQLDRLARAEIFQHTDKRPFRLDAQPQFYLAKTPWRSVPMTRAQRTRINLEAAYGRDPSRYLSPRQLQGLDGSVADADRDPVGYRRDEAFRLR